MISFSEANTGSGRAKSASVSASWGSSPASRMMVLGLGLVLMLGLLLEAGTATARADFGISPGSLSAVSLNKDGSIDETASSHPYSWTLSFALNKNSEGHSEGGEMRDLVIDLPRGMVGDPSAVPRCTRQEFEGFQPLCAADTQVGIVRANIIGFGQVTGALYNLVPPPGLPAQIGFSLANANALQNASVLTEEDYALQVATYGLPKEITELSATVWGVPANPGHDAQRGREGAEEQGSGVASTAPELAFLTLPATCSTPLTTTVSVDSSLDPGHYVSASVSSLDSGGNASSQNGCDEVPFVPQVSAQPTTSSADSASGLGFELRLPNEGLLNPHGIAETEPVKTVVTLPQGVVVNPSAASGLGVCTPAQYHAATATSGAGQGCPESSKVGTLLAKTPLLEEAIEGSVYLGDTAREPFQLAARVVHRREGTGTRSVD